MNALRIPGWLRRLGTAARLNAGTAAGNVLVLDSTGKLPAVDGSQLTGLASGRTAPIRQAILNASASAGANNAISAGSGLRLNLAANSGGSAYRLAFASGFDGSGAVDTYESITAAVTDMIGADLAANNTSFVYRTRGSAWGATLIPPQYGYSFDRSRASILNFEAADASTSIIDDFGNAWSVAGNAQIDTAQFKFGTASLLLDGTGDYIESSSFTSFGDGSWVIEGWVRHNALPSSTAEMIYVSANNASHYGFELGLYNNGGTYQMYLRASSNGSSDNITASAVNLGSTPTTGTWYHVAAVYDALAGKYYTYWNGTKVHEVTSSERICAITKIRLGWRTDNGQTAMNGWMDGFRFLPAAIYPNGTTFTPPAAAPAVTDYPMHYFAIDKMFMYEVTSANTAASGDPGVTARERLFVGEADTGASSVSAVRNYAIGGRYQSAPTSMTASTPVSFSHNIGTRGTWSKVRLVNVTAEQGYKPGEEIEVAPWMDGTPLSRSSTYKEASRCAGVVVMGARYTIINSSGGDSGGNITFANWRLLLEVRRGW